MERIINNKNNILRKITYGIIIAFVLSLIPIMLVSRYVYPQADDFGYGLWTHLAWVQTGAISSVLKEAIHTAIFYWGDWQGTYTSSFLMSLQPGIFDEKMYHIVPMLLILLLTVSIFTLVHAIMGKALKQPLYIVTGVALLMVIASMQNVKDQTEAFTWFNSGIHYTGMYAVWLLFAAATVVLIKNSCKYWNSHKDVTIESNSVGGELITKSKTKMLWMHILTCFLAFLAGGGNNVAVLWAVLVEISVIGFLLISGTSFIRKRFFYSNINTDRDLALSAPGYRKKYSEECMRIIITMLPSAITLFAGSALNLMSVGNQKRLAFIGGSHNSILSTILKSFGAGAQYSAKWIDGAVILFIIWLLPFAWKIAGSYTEAGSEEKEAGSTASKAGSEEKEAGSTASKAECSGNFTWPLPGLVLLYSYCLISALFAPNIYTGGISDMLRTQNAIFFIYILLITVNVIYFTGWLRYKGFFMIKKCASSVAFHCRMAFMAAIALTVVICGLMLIKNHVCFTSVSAAVTCINGNGRAYADILEYNFSQLDDDSKSDVIVKEITVQPSILYSKEIDWWKAGTVSYYGKNSVEYEQAD